MDPAVGDRRRGGRLVGQPSLPAFLAGRRVQRADPGGVAQRVGRAVDDVEQAVGDHRRTRVAHPLPPVLLPVHGTDRVQHTGLADDVHLPVGDRRRLLQGTDRVEGPTRRARHRTANSRTAGVSSRAAVSRSTLATTWLAS